MVQLVKINGNEYKHPIGEIKKEKFLPDGRILTRLRSLPPKGLVYDVTHDNFGATLLWNSQAILPLMCVLSMANMPIGSTRGVDEFFPNHPKYIVEERRLYTISNDYDIGPNTEIAKQAEEKKEGVEISICKDATKVVIAGTFNNWSTEANPLDQTEHGVWKTTLNLPPGHYEYKFVANGNEWIVGPGNTTNDGKGNINNVIDIGGQTSSNGKEMQIFDSLGAARKMMNNAHCFLGMHKTTSKTYNDVCYHNLLYREM